MNQFHEFDADQLAALARGDGGPQAIAALQAAQLSRHLLLVGHLLQQWPGGQAERDAIADTLDRARHAAPSRFAGVLGAPMVGSWSGIVVRATERGVADASDLGQLCGLAAVAAAASHVPADLEVPVRDGVVSVPGLGVLTLDGARSARLIADDGQLVVADGQRRVAIPADPRDSSVPGWQPVRRLTAVDAPGVALDDVDPYRHGHHSPPAKRLDEAAVHRWQALFAEAWGMLARQLPGRASELAAGLQTLVPLAQTDTRSARSATIRHVFGAFGLTLPPSAAEFAVTMVHEFQHSKLSAMLDLAEMTDPQDTRRYFAPWRMDPRPLAGLLQGVYAFVGVADTWRGLRGEDHIAEVATARFAEARLQVDRGLTAAEASGTLTKTGELLVAGLRARTDELLAEPLDAQVIRDAEQALADTHRQWADRNSAAVPAG